LLVASGNILDGHQPDGNIGSYTLADMLQRVREENAIKALVIRVDSGGGSSFASEVIRTEIEATRAAGIPVFISMGSLAASGGYWMAAGGDEIWATPTTLTGSIGVFGAFPTLEKTFANIGMTTDGIGTTELAGAARLDRELSPQASTIIQLTVDNIYQRFIRLVAEARDKETAEIEKIAEGRVWSGMTAKELGLVDELGSLNDVIAAAAKHVNIEDYSVEVVSQQLSTREMFLRQLASGNAGALAPKVWANKFTALDVQQQLIPLLKPLVALGKMNDPHAIYASCLDCIAP
jgi:protease-4